MKNTNLKDEELTTLELLLRQELAMECNSKQYIELLDELLDKVRNSIDDY